MKFALIDAEKAHFPVAVLCEVLEVSRSGFYAWQARPASAHAQKDAQLTVEITAAHAKSKQRYGSPRVHRALRKKGVRVSAKRVARLMREKGLAGRQKRRFRRTTDSKHSNPIAPNVLLRDFAIRGGGHFALLLPGRAARPVLAPRGRLGDELLERHGARPRRAPPWRPVPSWRPRRPGPPH